MSTERVFEAAARIGVSSRRMLLYLSAHGYRHSTASSSLLSSAQIFLLGTSRSDVLQGSARAVRPSHRPFPRFWHEDDYGDWDDEIRWHDWIGPDELTTPEAAAAFWVQPANIRQWVRRGHLAAVGRRGRCSVYRAHDVYLAAVQAGERNAQPGGPLTRDRRRDTIPGAHVDAASMADVVTGEVAARAVGVAPATLRSWAHRGHLAIAAHRGRTPLYRLEDVVAAARRQPHLPRRKPSRPI